MGPKCLRPKVYTPENLRENKSYIPSDLNLLLRPDILEVLITEDENFALSGIERQLVQTLLGQLRELNTLDLSAQERAEVVLSDALVKKMGLLGVRTQTDIGMF